MQQTEVKRWTTAAEPAKLGEQLHKFFAGASIYTAYEATYQSVPGVGFISARVLSNELGDLSQFANERQLFSYTGLTPAEYSSGETTRRGSITKQSNTHLRSILIEIAWRAIGKDPSLAAFFERIKLRGGSKRAIVAVARKLIGRIRAAFRQQVPYRIEEAETMT